MVPVPVKQQVTAVQKVTSVPTVPTQREVPTITPPPFRSNVAITEPKQNTLPVEIAPQKVTPPPPVALTQNTTTHTLLRYGILIGIVALGITLAVVASIYFNVFEKAEEPVRETTPTAEYFTTTKQSPLLLTGARETFLTNLKTAVIESSSLSSIYPTIVESKNVRPATASEILSFIGAHLEEKTIRSLSDTMMIGNVATKDTEAYIIMQSHSFDTLFAGLLAWELFIYSDFSPLFNTEIPIGATHFIDAVILNTPTRILVDEENRELLHYAVVNQKTVIITTSRSALTELIQKVAK
jgi:hypothetical protein